VLIKRVFIITTLTTLQALFGIWLLLLQATSLKGKGNVC
jgi:hypothetical protein